MASKEYLVNKIPLPNGKNRIIQTFQNANDIIECLRYAELNSRDTSKILSKYFNETDKYKVAAKVWYFLRTQIRYFAEPPSNQTAKTINRFLYDCTYKNGTGDCKHFATFATGILNACNIPTTFTFVGQNKYIKKPNHAYATALINGKEVIIDACRTKFNDECEYFYKWNSKIK